MLILTRDINEEMVIDERITIRILERNVREVVLGITAPRHVKIRRGEHKPRTA